MGKTMNNRMNNSIGVDYMLPGLVDAKDCIRWLNAMLAYAM